ncbi:MAG: type II toxin-antitoxin system VapC family toxin [Candidatus Ozemobacteraceae bacterium]
MPTTRTEKKLVLDTHVWFWLMNGEERLKKNKHHPLSFINQASERMNLLVSAISVWEISMLEAKGRVRFETGCLKWVKEALSAPGIQLLPLTPEIAIESTRLPGIFHGDPADHILVASARLLNADLVTADEKIHAYAKEGWVCILKACFFW